MLHKKVERVIHVPGTDPNPKAKVQSLNILKINPKQQTGKFTYTRMILSIHNSGSLERQKFSYVQMANLSRTKEFILEYVAKEGRESMNKIQRS